MKPMRITANVNITQWSLLKRNANYFIYFLIFVCFNSNICFYLIEKLKNIQICKRFRAYQSPNVE